MSGTFTNINIGRKAYNMNSGKYGEMFYDMVKLNLDGSTYVTSPYITVDDSIWVAEALGQGTYRIVCVSTTAEAGWSWYYNGEYQADATEAQLQSAFGLVITYPSTNPATTKALGDEINITKRVEYEGKYTVNASYTRRGAVLEVDCPLLRNTIPTSPYIGISTGQWEAAEADPAYALIPHGDGQYEWYYVISGGSASWVGTYNGAIINWASDAYLFQTWGITIYYPDESSIKSSGDHITVIRQTDSETGQHRYDYIYQQGDSVSPAQQLTDEIFKAVYGLGYQPLYADNAIINPAAEIGDTLTVCGVTSGLYYQEITFNRLMASNVGAPISNESEPEMEYESKQDRQYARKFADIAAEFTIQADRISAKVSKTSPVGQTSFSWELYDDHWTVLNGDTPMLYINSEGSQFSGKVRANQIVVDEITVNGKTLPAGYIEGSESGEYNQIALNSIGGGGSIGIGNLALDTVTAPNLTSTVNDDIQKGVDAYGMIAYGFGALSASEIYAGSLNVEGGTGGDYTNAYWCYNRVSGTNLYYLGHY